MREPLTRFKDHVLDGFDMFDLGSYPGILRGAGSIIVEIHVISREKYERIKRMELSSGYHEELVKVKGIRQKLPIFVRNDERDRTFKNRVLSGDWKKYLHDRKS